MRPIFEKGAAPFLPFLEVFAKPSLREPRRERRVMLTSVTVSSELHVESLFVTDQLVTSAH